MKSNSGENTSQLTSEEKSSLPQTPPPSKKRGRKPGQKDTKPRKNAATLRECSVCQAKGYVICRGMCQNCYEQWRYDNRTPEQIAKATERNKRNGKIWRTLNKARESELKAEYREANRDRINIQQRCVRYGIEYEDYMRMLEEQNAVCAICLRPPCVQRNLSIDHCHTTGKVRGLLCHKCNMALGKLDDDPETILRAHAYLKKP